MNDEITKKNDDHMESTTQVLKAKTAGQLIEYDPADAEDGDSNDETNKDTEAITKEEEWITKKKTELTTVRQIETRVKRQVTLEDGKVIDDSGPIVYTNTTEDKQKQESETTEKRNLAPPNGIVGSGLAPILEAQDAPDGKVVENAGVIETVKLVARPADGLLKESEEKRVVSHEEVDDRLETEEVRQLGDFSDEFYLKTVNKEGGVENFYDELAKAEKSLVPTQPRIISNTSKSFKTIDSENVHKRSLLQDDGTLVTEKKTDTEHEIIVDKELPDGAVPPLEIEEKSTQRYFKQKDEQNVDILKNGKIVDTQTKYANESTQVDSDGANLKRPGDWDTFSERIRKNKQIQDQAAMQFLKDRKDALTQQRLNFDSEEETRKGETMKWLESHFGSESSGSNDDSRSQLKPTKKTYFNVIIKSNHDDDFKNTTSWNVNDVKPTTRPSNDRTREFQDSRSWQANQNVNSYRHASSNISVNRHRDVEHRTEPKGEYMFNRSTSHGFSKTHVDDVDHQITRKPEKLRESSSFQTNSPYGSKSNIRRRSDFISEYDQRPVGDVVHFNTLDNRRRVGYRDEIKPPVKVYSKGNASDDDYYFKKRETRSMSREELDDEPKPQPQPQRPMVPLRKKTLEKRSSQYHHDSNSRTMLPSKSRSEPPPDFSQTVSRVGDSYQTRARSSEKINFDEPYKSMTPIRRPPPPLERKTLSPKSSYGSQSPNTHNTSKKSNRVGQIIRNSLRKFVNKIRSVSAERKFRNNSTNTSGSILHMRKNSSPADMPVAHAPTYQQYNLIDGHISSLAKDNDDEGQEHHYGNTPQQFNKKKSISYSNLNRIDNHPGRDYSTMNRTQHYYLGEDPYSRAHFVKRSAETQRVANGKENRPYQQYHTFDRFGRNHKRFTESTPNLNEDYRNIQTLPRGGNHYVHQSTTQFIGPKKPARMHQIQALNRSKSINIPEMDGSDDEDAEQEYKRMPYHGNEGASTLNPLKSPSIVNLINRNQKEHLYKHRDDDVQL